MTKMTEAQRRFILTAHHRVDHDQHDGGSDLRGLVIGARGATLDVLLRNGWASMRNGMVFASVTPAGLRAAGVDLDQLHAEALKLNAPVPAFNETVRFKYGGRVVSGTVSATVTGMPEGDKVIVYSPALGHTNRIDHGVTVSVADLLPDAPAEPKRWTLGALPVVIEAHVEHMSECIERMEVSRAEWDAMTPAQRRDTIGTFGTETMNGQGGYGASIVSGAPESDLDDPPNTPAEARTGVSDRVAAALQELADLRTVVVAHDAGLKLRTLRTLDRIEQLLRAEAGR